MSRTNLVVNHQHLSPGYSAVVTDTSNGMDPSPAELVDALQQVVGLVRAHFAAHTARLGVTPVEAKTLNQFAEPMTLKELSRKLGADLSNTAGTIDRLESRGLVRKEIHPTDRRARLLTLTEEGQVLRRQLDRAVFSQVPALDVLTPPQRRQLHALLTRITVAAREG
jgi:DNA-binding MarR family transcriptional regulator